MGHLAQHVVFMGLYPVFFIIEFSVYFHSKERKLREGGRERHIYIYNLIKVFFCNQRKSLYTPHNIRKMYKPNPKHIQ